MTEIKLISITSNNDGITINIPTSLLEYVTKHHPEGIQVTNMSELQNKVVFELENNLGSSESGLTGLQELLDKAIEQAAEWEVGCKYTEEL